MVGTAVPAHAKGPDQVQVSGPGIDGVWLGPTRRDDIDAWTLMEASDLFLIWGAARGGERPDLTDEQLGPAYVLAWYAHDHPFAETVAYPFAAGGAWVTTTDGMADWIRSGPRLRRVLTRLGATPPDAAAAQASVTAPRPTDLATTAVPALAALVAWWLR